MPEMVPLGIIHTVYFYSDNYVKRKLSVVIIKSSSGSRGRRPSPPALVKTSQKKRWPPPQAASFVSHQAPLGQISGSATEE